MNYYVKASLLLFIKHNIPNAAAYVVSRDAHHVALNTFGESCIPKPCRDV